jgi:transposase
MKIKRMGIDLAKNVFQLHGVDAHEKVVITKQLKRAQMLTWFANQEPMLIGMEACGGAHYWARVLTQQGHNVKLMAPQHVKPYVKSNKNDKNDAAAICEAVSRPSMRFVNSKSIEQQDMQCVHRVRERLIRSRTALTNEVRGLLAEYGIVIAHTGIRAVRQAIPLILEDADNGLSANLRELLHGIGEELRAIDQRIEAFDKTVQHHAHRDERAKQILQPEGVGPITASAAVTTAGDGTQFKSGRAFSAWIGLVPRQHSSGGKEKLGGISKRGDKRLRTLLIHGARAVIKHSEHKTDPRSCWINALVARSNKNIAAVALANKNARIIWAMLTRQEEYRCAA